MKEGIVYLVWAGPGDPGLITVRGLRLLQSADVVVYDHLVSERLVSEASGAEKIYVGKQGGSHALEQEQINQLLVDKAREGGGKRVVRLKGGDPFVFGRGGEEALFLQAHGVRFEVVPGVTAGIAGPAYAGIPVTHRGIASAFTLVTGHEDPTKPESDIDWASLAKVGGTMVFYMGVKNLPHIVSQLLQHGRPKDTPVALIRWGTCPRQQTVTGTLADIVHKAAALKPPAIILGGEVARLRESLNWFEKRPLFGCRVVVTRAREQASELSEQLEALGAEVIEFPTIKIMPPEDFGPLDAALRNASTFDWIVFTSANGVRHFFERCRAIGLDIRTLRGPRLCAIGPGTAAVLPYGEYNAAGNMTTPPDTTRFDQWVLRWPQARQYCIFAAVGKGIANARIGTPRFDKIVRQWIKFWTQHARKQGIAPEQICLLLVDEPSEPEQDEIILAWAKAIRAMNTGVKIWEDTCHPVPDKANQEMIAACHVLCPNRPMFLSADQGFRDFYVRQREQGRELAFYSCSGPVRLLDPYAYHRLQAWSAWQYGAKGSYFWAFSDSGGGSSWNEYTTRGVTYVPFYLDFTSVTPGKHMEAIRESVEDYEYLMMLRQEVAKAERAGNKGAALDTARRLLAEAASRVLNAEGANALRWNEKKDRTIADTIRVEILEAIAALRTK